MANNENLIPIPGRLHSVATEGHVAGANEIYDDTQQKDQETINSELIAAVGTGGSVDSRIAAAINALDSTKSQTAGADGLALSVTEADGKITSISGSIAANTYDANGAAAAAKSEVLGSGVGTDYNTLKKIEDKLSPIETAVGTGGSIDQRIEDATEDCAYLGENDGSAVIADFDPQTDTIWKKAQTLSSADKAQVKTNLGLPQEIYSKAQVNELVSTPHQNYVTVSTYASLPATGSADTIYRVSNYDGSQSQVDATMYSEYAWNGSGYTFLCKKSQVGEVFDISAYHSNAKYNDLADALGTNGANVPEGLRKGGMSVKFVSNSDNKYVQARCMSDEFTTDVTQWQGVDDEPTAGSDNLTKSSGIQQNCTIIKNIFFGKALNILYNLIDAPNWFVTDYIDVSDISVLEVNFGTNPNLTYCACAYDMNKAPVDFFSYDSPVRDINVPANTKYFRFSFYYKGGYYAKNKSNGSLVYNNELLPIQEVYEDLKKKQGNDFGVLDFNVVAYNVDKYFMFGYTEEQKTQYKNQIFPEYVNQMKSLFVFTQEDNIYGNVNREFWGNFFKYSYTPEDWWCGIYSKLPLIKTGVLELSPTHDWSDEYGYPGAYPRKYTWATTYINGKEVLLVSVHGGISSAQSREEEFQQLIAFCDDYDYVIMGGDTNHNAGGTSDTIFEMLHNAGYQTSNYGFWGGIDTCELNTPNAEKIDSIITKGFNLNSMDVISASIAWPDHHPVVSNINMEI